MESKKITFKRTSRLAGKLATLTLLLALAAFPGTSPAQYETATTTPQTSEAPTLQNPLELWVYLNNPRIISEKMLSLTVQAVWKLGVKADLDNLATVDLSPFKIEQVTIGERELFDNTQDYRVVQYLLSLPNGLKHGDYTIPSFSVPYTNEVDKTSGVAISSPITIRKVPILVETSLDRDVFDIGDKLTYTLTVHTEKNVKVLIENLERFNFEPFELLDFRTQKKTTGRLVSTTIEYTLAIYEIGTKKQQYEIPSIPVTYYIEQDNEHKVFRAEKDAVKTRVYKTPFVPVHINSLLKTVDIPLEGVKGPVCYQRHELCKRCHLPILLGIGILLVIGVFEFKRVTKNMPLRSKVTAKDPGELAAERLRKHLSSYNAGEKSYDDREFVAGIDSALRIFLGAQAGISSDLALSLTTSQFVNDHLTGKLAGDLAEESREMLKCLDTIIFGGISEKTDFEKLLGSVEALLAATVGPEEGAKVTS